MKTPSEILLSIAILGVLSGAVGTACLGIWRTIFWGLLFTFISNLFRLFYLWHTVAYWTPPQNIGVNPCPSDLPLLVTVNLSSILLEVNSWLLGLLVGVFCGETTHQNNYPKLHETFD